MYTCIADNKIVKEKNKQTQTTLKCATGREQLRSGSGEVPSALPAAQSRLAARLAPAPHPRGLSPWGPALGNLETLLGLGSFRAECV